MTESLDGFQVVLNCAVFAHNPEVAGSNPAPATNKSRSEAWSPEAVRPSWSSVRGSSVGSGCTAWARTDQTGIERHPWLARTGRWWGLPGTAHCPARTSAQQTSRVVMNAPAVWWPRLARTGCPGRAREVRPAALP